MFGSPLIVGPMKLILSFCAFCVAAPVAADPVVVFAAASLKEPIDALVATMDDVVVSYAGSGTLARQILQGAPADVVLLANSDWMDVLADAGLVKNVRDFASNELVLIGAADAPQVDLTAWGATVGTAKVAMGFTNAVPAGIYGKAALTRLDLWGDIQGNIVEVDSARAALALVARGEVPFGVTYATDAAASDNVSIVATFNPNLHPDIRYVGALVQNDGRAFLDLVFSPVGQSVFADAQFLPPVAR